ncbi:hypothetical protein CMEL01_02057 [Colletotrichum melonis]|uniref:Uncharacterized protein n=1 Tax=Colletotrichum melonis TaxID=1209925 RepID=A0AAI9UIG5_9PEZI|nr:hypothetical protein CMEL01_02057 [Colletotrichum melonis]
MIKPPFAPTPPPFLFFFSIFPVFMRPNHCPTTRLRVCVLSSSPWISQT